MTYGPVAPHWINIDDITVKGCLLLLTWCRDQSKPVRFLDPFLGFFFLGVLVHNNLAQI